MHLAAGGLPANEMNEEVRWGRLLSKLRTAEAHMLDST